MKEKNNVKYICAIDSIYSLYLYLLVNKNMNQTWFIFGKGVDKSISDRLRYRTKLNHPMHNKVYMYVYRFFIFFYLLCLTKIKKMENCQLFCHDFLRWSDYFLFHYNDAILLEDGLINYCGSDKFLSRCKHNKLYKFIYSHILTMPYGLSNKIKTVYLTGIEPIPESIVDKVKIVSLSSLWNSLTQSEKESVLYLFGIDNTYSFDLFKERKYILITQCFDTDNRMTELEKIEMYKSETSHLPQNQIIIKTHQREKTNYAKFFPEALVFDKPIPFQLILELLSNNVDKKIVIYSHSSTASYNLPENYQIVNFGEKYPV